MFFDRFFRFLGFLRVLFSHSTYSRTGEHHDLFISEIFHSVLENRLV